MIVEDEIIGSHTEDESQEDDINVDEIMSEFGIEQEEGEKAEPPIVEPKAEEKKGITVKFNKEDTFIEDDKVPELARKGLNYDKVEGRANDYQQALDRVAKQQGFKDHSELIANLDRIEQEQQEKAKNAFNETRQKVIDDLVYNGVTQEDAEAYADNNPYVKEAQRAIAERDASKAQSDSEKYQQTIKSQWDEVFTAFPDIEKRDLAFNGTQVQIVGENPPEWLTPEIIGRLNSGYKPIDAVTLSNMDKIQAQTKTKAQQRVIKEQQLGLRSKVETHAPSDNEKQVSTDVLNAFKAFGMTETDAKKYTK